MENGLHTEMCTSAWKEAHDQMTYGTTGQVLMLNGKPTKVDLQVNY